MICALFQHYNILKQLNLPQEMAFEFYKVHNGVVCQTPGNLNPYYLGFKIWENLYKQNDEDFKKLLPIREQERDASFIRKYLTLEIALEANLCQFQEEERYYIISEVADSEGYKQIRNTLANEVGMGGMPIVQVKEVIQAENTLISRSNAGIRSQNWE